MNLLNEINNIKLLRDNFLNNFNLQLNIEEELLQATNDNNINSIRIHKYLTNSGLIGKVKTARFLDSINLSEKTKIKDLNKNHIKEITMYVSKL
ncbi:hypothetical protein OAJ33_02300 [Acidimicrobiaceae bacterium]|nr:hypothetical protein [Acidimicrobiaceae bacterium]|tara:strand:- start:8882 stop:9163 length:282 start_codon:yes stop_codon:yes gene_type:complete